MLTILKAGREFVILNNVKFVEDTSPGVQEKDAYPSSARATVHFIDGSTLRLSDAAANDVLEYCNQRKAIVSYE